MIPNQQVCSSRAPETRVLPSSDAQTSTTRRRVVQAALGLITGAPALIRAQPKQIRLIVPLPAGGAADVAARLAMESWTQVTGTPVIVENKPGASYVIGMQAIQMAPTDGSVMMHVNSGMIPPQLTFGKYDMLKQLTMVGKFGATPAAIFVKADSPIKTPPELIAHLKARAGKANFGCILGGAEHITTVQLLRSNNCSAEAVGFKGGPDSVTALAQGELDFCVTALPLSVPFKGKIQPIAVMTDKRFSLAPDLPSFRETLGRAGSALEYYGGFALPSGTPTSIAENYYNTLSEAARNPNLINRLAGQMTTADVAPGAELQRLVSTDLQQWAPIASELNLKAN